LEFLEHEGDIRALEFLAEVLINQWVDLLKLWVSYQALKFNQVLWKFHKDRVRAVNHLNDFPILAFQ
jgi:hypothetical protein